MNEYYTFIILFHQPDLQQIASLSRLTKLWSNTIHLLYCSIKLAYNRGPHSPVSPNYDQTLYRCYTVPSTWPTTEGLTLPSHKTMIRHYTFVILFHQPDLQQIALLSRLTKLWSNTIHLLYCSIKLTYNRDHHSPVSPNYDLTLFICYNVLSNWLTIEGLTLPSHQTMIKHYTFIILFHQPDLQQIASLSRLTKPWSNTIHLLYCSINLTYNR